MKKPKVQRNYRLDVEDDLLIKAVARNLDTTEADVIQMLINSFVEEGGLTSNREKDYTNYTGPRTKQDVLRAAGIMPPLDAPKEAETPPERKEVALPVKIEPHPLGWNQIQGFPKRTGLGGKAESPPPRELK